MIFFLSFLKAGVNFYRAKFLISVILCNCPPKVPLSWFWRGPDFKKPKFILARWQRRRRWPERRRRRRRMER